MVDLSWIRKQSDSDLEQSVRLARESIVAAKRSGDRQRQAGFERDLRELEREAKKRGLTA